MQLSTIHRIEEVDVDIVGKDDQMARAPSFLAWHYTTAACFLQMLKRRAIVPHECADNSLGRPVTWFSVNEDFEPSARMVASRGNGQAFHFSINETAERGQGLVRLGVPVRTLLTCNELRRKAMMSDEVWDHLCEEARDIGSDPDQWFGCLNAVPLEQCTVEVRDEDGQWRRMQGATTRQEQPSGVERPRVHQVAGR